MPNVWEVAWISRAEFTPEWPFWRGFLSSVLIVIGKTFEGHVSNVLGHLGKFGMGCHQITSVFRKADMSVIHWPQEVEGPRMSFKGVEREAISCINSISEELETCRS